MVEVLVVLFWLVMCYLVYEYRDFLANPETPIITVIAIVALFGLWKFFKWISGIGK